MMNPDMQLYPPTISATLSQQKEIDAKEDDNLVLKRLIWVYFFLLIFEGALRKWILPGLATPLLVVRDPFALIIVVLAWQRGLFPTTPYLFVVVIIGIIGFFTAAIIGHGNLWVALFGARIFLLHYPLMFAIGRIFTRDDVVKVGKVLLVISIPLAVLIFLQFYSPQNAWVNRGLGNQEGSGFTGAMGFFRPSSTFSFTNGTTLFFSFVATFVVYFWLSPEKINRVLLLVATSALLVAIPLSISRSLFFGVGVTVVFALIAIARQPKNLWRVLLAMVAMSLLYMILLKVDAFAQALEVFTVRFEFANESEGGLQGVVLDRYLGGMVHALSNTSTLPYFGYGIGLGTNVGSMLTKGEVLYLISEGEWGRQVGELGPVMGISVIVIRLLLSLKISFASYARLAKGDFLPWILVSFGLLVLPQSQWGQPATLGFAVLTGGLMLASLRVKKSSV
jgi:hypothetical protein